MLESQKKWSENFKKVTKVVFMIREGSLNPQQQSLLQETNERNF
jgi:hypothetical protein